MKLVKKIIIKKGFFKKPSYKFSEGFLKKCVPSGTDSKSVVAYVEEADDQIVISAKSTNGITVQLEEVPTRVSYKEAVGFFSFRGDLFYRSKGAAGKSIKGDINFSEFVKTNYPEEFKSAISSDISNIQVVQLVVK